MSIKLIFRYPQEKFKSIENVFNAIIPFIDCEKITLEFPSQGVQNRMKNWSFLNKFKSSIIHVTGFDHYLLLFRNNRKTILTIHDIEALKRMAGIRYQIFKLLWFDIPIRNATVVTTISEFTKSELQSLGNYTTPIKVIYNPNIFQIVEKASCNDFVIPKILIIGTKKNKNLVRIFKAFENSGYNLQIVGELSESQLKQLTNLRISFDNHVNISKSELKKIYSNVSLLCFASLYEGFGLPIIEAQSLGCPVVTSNCSSMPEIAGQGACLVNPLSQSEILFGVKKVLDDKEYRHSIVKNGFENIKRFKPELIAKQYQAIYEKLGCQ